MVENKDPLEPVKATTISSNDDVEDEFEVGDHVYHVCEGGMYIHHGVVVEVKDDGTLVIADFVGLIEESGSETTQVYINDNHDDNNQQQQDKCSNDIVNHNTNSRMRKKVFSSSFVSRGSVLTGKQPGDGSLKSSLQYSRSTLSPGKVGVLRFIPITNPGKEGYKKVKYNVPIWEYITSRPGTCTTRSKDDAQKIVERVNFLVHCWDLIPSYHALYSNCETVAFWCCCGSWQTIQGRAAVTTATNTAKASGVAGATAAIVGTTTVVQTVPAAGVWGFMGYTTTVTTTMPLLAGAPVLAVTLLVGAGLAAGVAVYGDLKCKHEWNKTTRLMNEAFEQHDTDHDRIPTLEQHDANIIVEPVDPHDTNALAQPDDQHDTNALAQPGDQHDTDTVVQPFEVSVNL